MRPPPRIFLPNRLSYLRILIGLAIPWLLFWPVKTGDSQLVWTVWASFGLFVLGALTDFWDGWLARRHQMETPIGRILDPTADKVFILACMMSFAVKGIYSYWILVPIMIREVAVTFCRFVWLRQGRAIGAERAGKLKLGLQVASVVFSFLFLGYPHRITESLNGFFIWLALGSTLYSGYFFFKHNIALLREPGFAKAVASLGVGNLRPFPGTYGSLLGLLIVFLVSYDFWLHLLIVLAFIQLAYWAIPRMGLGDHEDPLEVVLDEVCGILLAFMAVPLTWQSVLAGFCLFRFFDVTKFYPINRLEERKGVHGILLDDLGAGLYTWLVLKLLFRS